MCWYLLNFSPLTYICHLSLLEPKDAKEILSISSFNPVTSQLSQVQSSNYSNSSSSHIPTLSSPCRLQACVIWTLSSGLVAASQRIILTFPKTKPMSNVAMRRKRVIGSSTCLSTKKSLVSLDVEVRPQQAEIVDYLGIRRIYLLLNENSNPDLHTVVNDTMSKGKRK